MNDLEEEGRIRFKEFWNIYTSRGDDIVERVMNMTDEKFNGFGTVISENWKCKKDLKSQLEREIKQIPNGYKMKFYEMRSSHSNNNVTIWTKLIVEFNFNGKIVVIDDGRITGTVIEDNGKLLISQLHVSVPDASIEDEVAPGSLEPRSYDLVSVLFTDFVGFTKMTSTISPSLLVGTLNELFAKFDEIIDGNELLKIKTIGDAYMAVSGTKGEKDHANKCVDASFEIIEYLNERNKKSDLQWNIRVGIHSGGVIGGIIGSKNMSFDIWGDTVNVASRIESAGLVNKVNVSLQTNNLIKEDYDCQYRGKIEVKGKGQLDMFWVEAKKKN